MGRKDSIELSPEYGVNPTMPVCFFCGKERGEIALMGHVRKKGKNGRAIPGSDVEMPRACIIDYEPCDKCKEGMAKGIAMIGVTDTAPDGRPPIAHGMYPTGAWVVVSEDFIRRNIVDEQLAEGIIKSRKTIVDDVIVRGLIEQANEIEKGED